MAIRGSGALPASEINSELGLTTNAQISIGGAVPRGLAFEIPPNTTSESQT